MIFQATAVIVVYRVAPQDAPAYRSLTEARKQLPTQEGRVSIVLWDNSPEPHDTTDLPEDVTYLHDPRNPGLALAYNTGLEIASRQGSEWLITLDHDTTVLSDYLVRLAATSRLCMDRSEIGAIVPQMALGKKRLSPYHFSLGALPKWYPQGYRGIPAEPVFAFNSGSMIRVDALRQISGYDLRFPQDHSDTLMFYKLHQHGKCVYVDGDIQLEHELSFIAIDRRLSPDRYRRALLAESAFWDLHMSWLAGCERTMRLFLRLIRQWIRRVGAEYRGITLKFLIFRIFRTRAQRLRKWNELLA
jgi:GT2 family glycosyltransferase